VTKSFGTEAQIETRKLKLEKHMSKLMIEGARLAFPNLFKQRTNEKGEPGKFGALLIIPPTHPAVKLLNAAFDAVAREKWGQKADVILKGLRAQDRLALHDGSTKAQYDGFEGNLYISSSSDVRPTVIDRDRSPLSSEDGKPYAGSYVNASIEIWAQDNPAYGKRINAQLRGVQFLRDGDAFAAGRPADVDEFADLGDQGDVDPAS
jgi:hypothetical protein